MPEPIRWACGSAGRRRLAMVSRAVRSRRCFSERVECREVGATGSPAPWKYQGRIDPRRLVFIDETWAKTNMARTHGCNRRGAPLIGKMPHGHWKTLIFLVALRDDRIAAPCAFDGPIFPVYV